MNEEWGGHRNQMLKCWSSKFNHATVLSQVVVLYLSPIQFLLFFAKLCSPVASTLYASLPSASLLVHFLFVFFCWLSLFQPNHHVLSPSLPMDTPSPSRAHHGPTTDSDDVTTVVMCGKDRTWWRWCVPMLPCALPLHATSLYPCTCMHHLTMSPGPRYCMCHIAVPLVGVHAISPCSSCQLTLLVCFSFFIFHFFC